MSVPDSQGPAAFEPVKVGPRRRRIDPLAVGVVVVAFALALAVAKPWDRGAAGIAVGPSPGASADLARPTPFASPAVSTRGALVLPTWSDIVPVVSRQTAWGIRTIVLGASEPGRYAERWVPAEPVDGKDDAAVVEQPDGQIIALGLTFPPTETPLDVRIWLEHVGGELEWMDVRPVNEVPAGGAYLFLRRGVAGAAVRAWAPGRYRMDVLVAGSVHRIDVLIRDRTGRLPDPDPWPLVTPPSAPFYAGTLVDYPTGLFVQTASEVTALPATAGPPLDEVGAWLDVDPSGRAEGAQSSVARTYQPDIVQAGVVLPAYSTVKAATVHRLAPTDDATGTVRWTGIVSLAAVSYVGFGPAYGVTWRPGVYAISVSWEDGAGPHHASWHIELRPGPLPATPMLLSATRSWARFVGSSGVLLGVTESLTGTDPLGVRLLDIVPQTKPGYPGLGGTDLIGCGATHVQGRPEVVGIVGPPSKGLSPVASRILYPFADEGPLEVLTASGSVPGLTLIAPVVTAELDGPASYGFRAGTGQDAPGYTICIGLPAGG